MPLSHRTAAPSSSSTRRQARIRESLQKSSASILAITQSRIGNAAGQSGHPIVIPTSISSCAQNMPKNWDSSRSCVGCLRASSSSTAPPKRSSKSFSTNSPPSPAKSLRTSFRAVAQAFRPEESLFASASFVAAAFLGRPPSRLCSGEFTSPSFIARFCRGTIIGDSG